MFNFSKNKLIFIGIVAFVLVFAFFAGDKGSSIIENPKIPVTNVSAAKNDLQDISEKEQSENVQEEKTEEKSKSESVSTDVKQNTVEKEEIISETVEKDEVTADTVPSETASDENVEEEKELNCTVSITCETILNNQDSFNSEKIELVPADGVILSQTSAVFYEGESVFNVLQRETKKNKIHMEFENVPLYNSAYIEGIGNIYELDCGGLSGWMYRVNGEFPNYGASQYELKDGDTIEWIYTCDLGADIGGADVAGNNSK